MEVNNFDDNDDDDDDILDYKKEDVDGVEEFCKNDEIGGC